MAKIDDANVVIFCYPPFAGGNFLINCLGLSDDAVLQDKHLASLQLNNKFDLAAKIQFIHRKLDSAKQKLKWTDLDIGSGQLLGSDHKQGKFNDIVYELIDNQYHLFIVSHGADDLKNLLELWKNSKVVVFENYKNFIEQRIASHQVDNVKFDIAVAKVVAGKEIYRWDTDSYFDLEKFLVQYNQLAQWVGVTPVDNNVLISYYTKWLETINYIRDNK